MPKKSFADDVKKAIEKDEEMGEDVKISIYKYFEIHKPEVGKYVKAYIGAEYRNVLKTKGEWDTELKGKIQEV